MRSSPRVVHATVTVMFMVDMPSYHGCGFMGRLVIRLQPGGGGGGGGGGLGARAIPILRVY